jgi:hypothetical protein
MKIYNCRIEFGKMRCGGRAITQDVRSREMDDDAVSDGDYAAWKAGMFRAFTNEHDAWKMNLAFSEMSDGEKARYVLSEIAKELGIEIEIKGVKA